MKTEQMRWSRDAPPSRLRDASLVLAFGQRAELERSRWFEDLRSRYPAAHIFACSTAGEIAGAEVGDLGIVVTAIRFERTRLKVARVNVREFMDAYTAGVYLARAIDPAGLAHVMVLCDGQLVNGSELVRGMSRHLPKRVAITGGLAGDGVRFERTYVCADGPPIQGLVAALAFYGDSIRIGYGSLGGWDAVGPQMVVTRSRGNVVEQIDGRPALAVYRGLIGADADGLPASGLLHPLLTKSGDHSVVRTLLNVNAATQALVFAGDVPVGSRVQTMQANFERLIDGASGAANAASLEKGAQLALLISCVGRRLVLGERTVEEVAAVQKALGAQTVLTGFYSYGEICPAAPEAGCDLQNQTMTITTLSEED